MLKNYVIIERKSRLMQQDENAMLCVFIKKKDAEAFMKNIDSKRASELVITECAIGKYVPKATKLK